MRLVVPYLGGPTALLELGGLRLLTDPTFDPPPAPAGCSGCAVVPVHLEGWAHFTEGRAAPGAAFDRAGLADRLHLPAPGEPVER